jgi:hypothetical protein
MQDRWVIHVSYGYSVTPRCLVWLVQAGFSLKIITGHVMRRYWCSPLERREVEHFFISIFNLHFRNHGSKRPLTAFFQTILNKKNSVALSPQANYTDWATSTCLRNLVPTFVDRGVSRGLRGGSPTVVNLSFLDRSRYCFFHVAPHLSSQWLSGPPSRPTATQKIW